MKVCILDAWHADDIALVNSHWVAERTAEALGRELPGGEVETIAGDDIDRVRVSAELQRPYEGFAYFGHGRERGLFHRKVMVVGPDEVRHIGDRWFHAFACLSGDTLCKDAAEAGAAAYLGYSVSVIVEWEASVLPAELQGLLKELVAAATLLLARGERSRATIRLQVRGASERLTDWLDTHVGAYEELSLRTIMGLYTLASLLHRELVLEGSAVCE